MAMARVDSRCVLRPFRAGYGFFLRWAMPTVNRCRPFGALQLRETLRYGNFTKPSAERRHS